MIDGRPANLGAFFYEEGRTSNVNSLEYMIDVSGWCYYLG
jgi:hypothetical protein